MVALIVPSNAYEQLYIDQLEKSVKAGNRRRFTWISKRDILELVRKSDIFLMSMKKKRDSFFFIQ